MDIHINQDDLSSEYIEACLSQWKRVVAFYTLRLILAPIIETVLDNEINFEICSKFILILELAGHPTWPTCVHQRER